MLAALGRACCFHLWDIFHASATEHQDFIFTSTHLRQLCACRSMVGGELTVLRVTAAGLCFCNRASARHHGGSFAPNTCRWKVCAEHGHPGPGFCLPVEPLFMRLCCFGFPVPTKFRSSPLQPGLHAQRLRQSHSCGMLRCDSAELLSMFL